MTFISLKSFWVIAFFLTVFPAGAQAPAPTVPGAATPAKPLVAPDSLVIGRALHLVEDQGAEGAGLVIDLTQEVKTRVEVLSGPDRLVIDLEGVAFAGGTPSASNRGVGPVSAWRAGLFMLGQSRIVLDLARPALVERVDFVRQAGIVRLVVQIKAVPSARFEAQAKADQARRLALRTPEPGAAAVRKSGAKPLLVLDPGHGGIDPGASGPRGEAEKDIVLGLARAVRKAIEADGRIEVQLTRDDDRFIALGERVAFARGRGAALFVSLHADSLFGESDVRGASVYTLSERASDADAARAAEKENRADMLAGLDVSEDKREGVDDILFDLARRETRLFSQMIARNAVTAIQKGARLHKTPLRSAGFRVLRAPDMPSILVELGYLSNAEDLAALTSDSAREKLAAGLAEALVRFIISGRDAISAKTLE